MFPQFFKRMTDFSNNFKSLFRNKTLLQVILVIFFWKTKSGNSEIRTLDFCFVTNTCTPITITKKPYYLHTSLVRSSCKKSASAINQRIMNQKKQSWTLGKKKCNYFSGLISSELFDSSLHHGKTKCKTWPNKVQTKYEFSLILVFWKALPLKFVEKTLWIVVCITDVRHWNAKVEYISMCLIEDGGLKWVAESCPPSLCPIAF